MTSLASTHQPGRIQQVLKAAFNSRLMHRLTYPHRPDRFIELFDPVAVSDETVGTISAIEHPTERSVRVQIRPNSRWQGALAGQYVPLSVEINGRRQRRMFSPAQSQHAPGALEFTMAVNPDGRLTRHLKTDASVGDRVVLGDAGGSFHLPGERPAQLVLISAGSGITPVLAMLRTLVDEQYTGQLDFIHYCRGPADALYAETLHRLRGALPGLRIHVIHTRAGGGHFHRAQLQQMVPGYAAAHTFVCGPAPLLEATRALFDDEGIAERLHQEAFGPALPTTGAADDTGGAVYFQRSERQLESDGTTLLEQAEKAGLTPEHGCRMGVCFACSCKKTSGRVRDLRTGEISDADEQEIQVCVSQPVGPVTLDL